MELASFSRRFLALGLDLLILSLPLSIILMTYAILNDLQLYAPYYQTGIDLVPEIVYRFYPVLLPTFSIWALVIFLYFWLTTLDMIYIVLVLFRGCRKPRIVVF